jgi:hypothetical protein
MPERKFSSGVKLHTALLISRRKRTNEGGLMKSRRDILKCGFATTIGLCINNPLSLLGKETCQGKRITTPIYTAIAWRQTIFCQFDHEELKQDIERCSRMIGCRIWYGEPDSSDIHAVGSFVQIIDRNTLGLDCWHEYVQYSDETYDDVPCLLVDAIMGLPIPQTKYVLQYDLSKPGSILAIVEAVKTIRLQMIRNLPKQLQHIEIPSKQKTQLIYSASRGWGKRTYFDW